MAELTEKGMPTQGPQTLPILRGTMGHGLKLAGTATASGASGLTTAAKQLTFNTSVFPADGSGRVPRTIQLRAVGQTLALKMGDGTITMAADTFTPVLFCTSLFLGLEDWYATGGGTANIEYVVNYS